MSSRIICNTRISLSTSDWDYQCYEEITSKKGFRITQDGKSDTDRVGGYYSIHSPLYGTDYDDEHAFEDRHSCECGNYMGKNYEGKICPICKKKVEFIDIDMTKTGWIILDRDTIIHPLYYNKIQAFIGKRILDEILKFKDPLERDISPSNIFDGIGMIEFKERFGEIMNFYLKKSQKKMDLYLFIMGHEQQIFCQSIPVYSSHLRPFVVRSEEIKYSKEDRYFKHIWTSTKLLNDRFELERRIERASNRRNNKNSVIYLRRENILYSIQNDIMKIWELTFETVKKKTGTIRNNILGGRLNYTARNVIIPDKNLRSDEIRLNYATFIELYKLEIISILKSMYDIPSIEAWDIWEKATVVYDDRIYKIMLYMIENRDLIVEINRNPTKQNLGRLSGNTMKIILS